MNKWFQHNAPSDQYSMAEFLAGLKNEAVGMAKNTIVPAGLSRVVEDPSMVREASSQINQRKIKPSKLLLSNKALSDMSAQGVKPEDLLPPIGNLAYQNIKNPQLIPQTAKKVGQGLTSKYYNLTPISVEDGKFRPDFKKVVDEFYQKPIGSTLAVAGAAKTGKKLYDKGSELLDHAKEIDTQAYYDVTGEELPEGASSGMTGNNDPGVSNNLYHTTPQENLESIAREGLVVGKKPRFEGVSSSKKISFSANERGAEYYGGDGDVMLRTKAGFDPGDLDIDPLAGGEGTYTTGKNVPPELLEVKIDGEWKPLISAPNQAIGSSQYVYHETDLGNLESIYKKGLIPSKGMYGKGVYFSPIEGMGESSARGLMIRAKVGDINNYNDFGDEGWSEHIVPPEVLEVKLQGKWKPLSEAIRNAKKR